MNKKVLSTIMALVLCLGMLLSVASCGGAASMEGKWVISAMKMNNVDMLALLVEIGKSTGTEVKPEDIMFFEFKNDGKFTAKMDETDDELTEGTWKLEGNKLTLTADDEPMEATLNGNSFSVTVETDEGKLEMIFTKK